MQIDYTLHPYFFKLIKLIIPFSGQNIFQLYSVTNLKRNGECQHAAFSCCTWNAEKIFYYYLYLSELAVLATPGVHSTQVCLMSLLWNNQTVLWEINRSVAHLLIFFCYACLIGEGMYTSQPLMFYVNVEWLWNSFWITLQSARTSNYNRYKISTEGFHNNHTL